MPREESVTDKLLRNFLRPRLIKFCYTKILFAFDPLTEQSSLLLLGILTLFVCLVRESPLQGADFPLLKQ